MNVPDVTEDGERLADAYDLDVKADGLVEAADAFQARHEASAFPVWLRSRAEDLRAQAEQLVASVPPPEPRHCEVMEINGEQFRIQALAPLTPGDRVAIVQGASALARLLAAQEGEGHG